VFFLCKSDRWKDLNARSEVKPKPKKIKVFVFFCLKSHENLNFKKSIILTEGVGVNKNKNILKSGKVAKIQTISQSS
jgi:hypothetical protein